ncbi:MAG: DNA polymerase [Candidatus Saccharibacteria bacterium]|nr:DNA polymerase [Candidatus Saccharibacteria bacterium]
MAEKRLVIIDGKSVFYRGYYAMRNLSKSDGTPTSGVYGFATIAMEIVKKLDPTVVVVAWDKAKTSTAKRKAIYADYKAGRVKPPEDFYVQIPILQDLILALGWNFVECDNYEADDIIGTLALQADEDLNADGVCKWDTYIVSSDLDMLQIVDENTRMYRLLKGFSELEEMDVSAVEAKYGIKKRQFLDLKALKGDSSDNIPGVLGIGEKTAVKLLNDYGDLDGIYAHIDEITGSTGKKLVEGKDSAYMSKELAVIMTDAPVKLSEAALLKIDANKIIEKLQELEFYSLIRKYKKIFENNIEEKPEIKEEITIPNNINLPNLIAHDVKDKMHRDKAFREKILGGEEYWDLDQAEFLLNPLARKEADVQTDLFEAMETEEDLKKQATEQMARLTEVPAVYKIYSEFDLPLIPVLYKMEEKGILIDKDFFAGLAKEFGEKVSEIEQRIFSVAGISFNINSPVQLSDVLFNKLQIPSKGLKKTKKGISTGAETLEKIMDLHEIVPMILEYREVSKLLSTYVMPLPELADKENRIHTTFTQNVTATGRLSSVNPNLQNIPIRKEAGRRIREGMVAPKGRKFVAADYAQFELRLAAVLSGDEKLMRDFETGVDIHTKTASEVFGVEMDKVTKSQRRAAKVINFGVMYGMSVKRLADQTGMSYGEAKEFVDNYFEVRKPIKDYLAKTLTQARNLGYVETFYGRRRPTPDVNSSNFVVRQAAERAAQNMPIQGTEADLMKRAMIAIDKVLPKGAELVLQIHDSLVVECDDALVDEVKEILKREMEGVAPELKVKLAVDVKVGDNLAEV